MATKAVQAQTFQLAGSGVSEGDNQMILETFTQIDGTLLTMTNFGTKGYGTLEPASGKNEEQITFTGVTQNSDGTATLTGVSTVLNVDPYTETANFAQSHAGGVAFVISNTAGWYGQVAFRGNDETITGTWLVPTPTVATQIANKQYVDAAVISGGVPATTSNPGISIEAAQADVDAKTASRTYMGTPYELFVNPATLRATKYNDYTVDSGTANTYAITPIPGITAYAAGQQFVVLISNTNTGVSTINVSGLGAKSIAKSSGTLSGGELQAGAIVVLIYNGTNFLITSSSSASVGGVGNVTIGLTTATTLDQTNPTSTTITHSLGVIPKMIKITTTRTGTGGSNIATVSQGIALINTGTGTISSQINSIFGSTVGGTTTSNSSIAGISGTSSLNQSGTLSGVSSSQMVITFSGVGFASISPSGTMIYQWEVYA